MSALVNWDPLARFVHGVSGGRGLTPSAEAWAAFSDFLATGDTMRDLGGGYRFVADKPEPNLTVGEMNRHSVRNIVARRLLDTEKCLGFGLIDPHILLVCHPGYYFDALRIANEWHGRLHVLPLDRDPCDWWILLASDGVRPLELSATSVVYCKPGHECMIHKVINS